MKVNHLQDKKIFYILAATLVILFVLFITLLSRQRILLEEQDSSYLGETLTQAK